MQEGTRRKKRCLGEGGIMSTINVTVSPSHWHPCAETSSDPSDGRHLAPCSPVHGHWQECILSLTQSNGRFFCPPKAPAAPEHRGFFSHPCKRGASWVLAAVEGTQAAWWRKVQALSCTSPSLSHLSPQCMEPQGHGQPRGVPALLHQLQKLQKLLLESYSIL